MIATGYEKYGLQEELEKDAIKHLFDVSVKVNKDAEADLEVRVEVQADGGRRREHAQELAVVAGDECGGVRAVRT